MDVINGLNYSRYAVVLTGLVGNFISFIVFSGKKFQKNSISVYSRALVVVNSIVCLSQVIDDTATVFYGVILSRRYQIGCKLAYMIYIGISPISGWILVFFSIDKALCVVYPNRFSIIHQRKFQLGLIAGACLIIPPIFVYVPIAINNSVTEIPIEGTNLTFPLYDCSWKQANGYKIMNSLYLSIGSFIPFFLMITSSVLTIRGLIQSRKRLEVRENHEMESRRAKDRKFAINSIALNLFFIILLCPISFSYLIPIDDFMTYLTFFLSTVLLYFINFAMPFFTYFAFNSVFRKELLRIIKQTPSLSTTMSRSNKSTHQTQ